MSKYLLQVTFHTHPLTKPEEARKQMREFLKGVAQYPDPLTAFEIYRQE